MKKVTLNKTTALRSRSLGILGELYAMKALVDSGYDSIKNLNDNQSNHPYGDLLAMKGNITYVISVKARNKFQNDGAINPSYRLGKNCHEKAKKACEKYSALPYWMAISFDLMNYSVYFGSLNQLDGKKAIPMSPNKLSNYECLVNNKKHGLDFGPYKNTYKPII